MAIMIIAVLSFYAINLLIQVSKQKEIKKREELKIQLRIKAHDNKVFQSVLLLTRAMQEHQCELSEGCWRVCVLLQSLKISNKVEIKFPAIFDFYNEIKHFSILDDRKSLVKKERMKQDFTRLKIEALLHDKIIENLDLLHKYATKRIAILSS